uniref:Low density lipoprotein receptor class A domain containing 4b n=1 Tax=Cyprinus carpio TaxID=7962 RepID=A0A8C1GFF1_CYPCA
LPNVDVSWNNCRFLCTNGRCLNLGSQVCDQLNHCGDNSDEEHCPLSTQHPASAIFSCESISITLLLQTQICVCVLVLMKSAFVSKPPARCEYDTFSLYFLHSLPSALQVVYAPQPRDRFTAPTFMQHNRFRRFQPTYPYLQQEIDLPPTISLSDGEEPPPYQGPCTLQLRDPEQQLELNRESVRAPPNRTIFDSDLIDMHSSGGGGPRPPSSNSGISAASSSTHGRMEGPPPAYSQVIGQQSGIVLYLHQHSNNPPVPVTVQTPPRGRTDLNSPESTIALSRDRQREELV